MSLRLGLLLALWSFPDSGPQSPPPMPVRGLVRLGSGELQVTHGALESLGDGRLGVEVAEMRAVSRRKGAPVAELRFTYFGPTRERAPLASGEERQQLGLKLRAQDGCNLVYVMWRVAPRAGLVVSVKRNSGERSVRDECGARGYRNVKPRWSAPLPAVLPGAAHTLRAQMEGERLWVAVDGRQVWEGAVGPDALAFDGPVGVRSDNVRLTLELLAEPP